MGLIDEGTPAAGDGAVGAPAGDMIAKTRAAIEQKVPAEQQDVLQRIVLAGKKILYDKSTHSAVEQQLRASDNPAEAAGKGAAQLMGILMKESRGSMPSAVVIPATMVLMTEILDYLKQTDRIEGTADDVNLATRTLSELTLRGAGVTPDHLDSMLGKTSEAMNDPNIAAAMQKHMQGA